MAVPPLLETDESKPSRLRDRLLIAGECSVVDGFIHEANYQKQAHRCQAGIDPKYHWPIRLIDYESGT